jgi:hypothetical protein
VPSRGPAHGGSLRFKMKNQTAYMTQRFIEFLIKVFEKEEIRKIEDYSIIKATSVEFVIAKADEAKAQSIH